MDHWILRQMDMTPRERAQSFVAWLGRQHVAIIVAVGLGMGAAVIGLLGVASLIVRGAAQCAGF